MNLLLQLELALHDADCPGHADDFKGHGDKYRKLAEAAAAVFPPEMAPYWLRDLKLLQEPTWNLILDNNRAIRNQLQRIEDQLGG